MMREYKQNNRWQSPAQAVAVAYSKTRKLCQPGGGGRARRSSKRTKPVARKSR